MRHFLEYDATGKSFLINMKDAISKYSVLCYGQQGVPKKTRDLKKLGDAFLIQSNTTKSYS